MTTPAGVPNPALRAHATGGFHLGLGRTHVAALVLLDTELRHHARISASSSAGGRGRNAWSNVIVGMRGLEDRGLIRWTKRGRRDDGKLWTTDEVFELTNAGKAVIVLLLEAGIYQEYAGQLPARDEWWDEREPGQRWTAPTDEAAA